MVELSNSRVSEQELHVISVTDNESIALEDNEFDVTYVTHE
jgi:hypothetical protein